MTDDRHMAELLGAAPNVEPAFRIDVFTRIVERAHRRRVWERAALKIAGFTALGLLVAALQRADLSADAALPVLTATAGAAAAGLFAMLVAQGPKAMLARSRAALRLAA